MAVIGLNAFEAAPGKLLEAIGLLKEGQEILGGLGAKTQLMQLVSGGTLSTLALAAEAEDAQSFGARLDETYADAGYQGFVARVVETQALIPTRSLIYTELPGLEVPFDEIADAKALMVTLFQIRDGRFQDSVERIGRAKGIVEEHGGRMRAINAIVSDPFGVTATPVYYPSLTEWGKAGQALANDPRWLEFQLEMRGENASADFLRTSLYQII